MFAIASYRSTSTKKREKSVPAWTSLVTESGIPYITNSHD